MEPTAISALMQDAKFLDAYEVLDELGRGSFGQVYRARQRSTGRDVAIKVAQLVASEQPDVADRRFERFRRELRLCAQLSHPNIVRLIDSGEASDGSLYAVFEHVAGMTLKDVLTAESRLEPREAAHLLGQVLDALSCAHAQGIIHRDVTPANIMLAKPGARRNALVLDFGLGGLQPEVASRSHARITATHELLGTPCYAAPEQLRGEPPTPASDLYSWGLVLLECVTGEIPFRDASAQDVIYQQLGPEPIAIPRWLRSRPLGRVIESVTAKQPENRLTDVAQLLRTLSGVASDASDSITVGGAATIERERRQLTVTCCRVSVAAPVEREVDVEEVDQLIRAQHAALAAQAAAAGGTVVAVLADRIFMVHGYPQAREGDARRAARTALEMVQPGAGGPSASTLEPRCVIHVGMHTGLVIVPDPRQSHVPPALELTGLTAQIASRLADFAGEGEVRVSADTNQLVRTDFDSTPAGECVMSELSRPLATYRISVGLQRALDLERSGNRQTPLIGRQREIDALLDGWSAAHRHRPGVVLISGEAGIGKSRLLRELRQRVGLDSWVAWECTAEGQTTPFRPIVDALAVLDEPLESLLARLDMSVQDLAILTALMSKSSLGADTAGVEVSPDRQKALTIETILTLLFKLAETRPMVLAVENLHWADPTTIELLRILTLELGASRAGDPREAPQLFVALTTRPEFIPGWAGENISFLPLQRLAEDDVVEMVRANLGGASPSASLIEAVVRRAEGVPLFVEEITRLVDDAQRRAALHSDPGEHHLVPAVPASLRDLLTARLDGVSPAARETARLASALGREFGFDLLHAVSQRPDALLREDVAELAQAGLIFPRRTGGGQRCVFRHALLQDAAYEALMRPDREALHRRIAQVLHSEFREIAERRPEVLALHHERGGELEPAADWWLLAGYQSYRAAAYAESMSQAERGMALVRTLEPTAANRNREINLLICYGTAIGSTTGWASASATATFKRAIEIAERAGEQPPLMALYGLWGTLITTSDRAGVEAFLPRIEALLESSEDRTVRRFCWSLLGIAACWRGDARDSHALLERALQTYDEEEAFPWYDGGIYTYAFQFCNLWTLGFADRARALRDVAFTIARRRRDPYSLGVVLSFGGVLAMSCGDADTALAYGEQLMALAAEQRMVSFYPAGASGYGAGLVMKGRAEEGLRFIREGVEGYRNVGFMGSYSDHQTYLASACIALDRIDEAMAAINEGFALCETLYARLHECELWRLQGFVQLRRGDLDGAEASMRRALEIATAKGNVGMALRAATRLAKLLHRVGREAEGVEILRPIFASFTEGFDTPDLLEAGAYLARMGALPDASRAR